MKKSGFSARQSSERCGLHMIETIHDGKYVELTYKVIDKNRDTFSPRLNFRWAMSTDTTKFCRLSYTRNSRAGPRAKVIEVPIDGNRIFGARDESLVFTDRIENVPEEYRQIGTSILMENDNGQTRSFIVTKIDDKNTDCRRQ
jgi:FKBP-type peptidyl-prolyl cis-trans isomerase SlyD